MQSGIASINLTRLTGLDTVQDDATASFVSVPTEW